METRTLLFQILAQCSKHHTTWNSPMELLFLPVPLKNAGLPPQLLYSQRHRLVREMLREMGGLRSHQVVGRARRQSRTQQQCTFNSWWLLLLLLLLLLSPLARGCFPPPSLPQQQEEKEPAADAVLRSAPCSAHFFKVGPPSQRVWPPGAGTPVHSDTKPIKCEAEALILI